MTEREQLRDRLARAFHLWAWDVPLDGVAEVEQAYTFAQIDAILSEIEAAGYVLMERGRAERLIEEARTMQAAYADGGWGESELQPGDLDPLEGGE